ncbi:MAG: OsmC family peroxiredoxin, partial [Hyphomicrobiales bacterium]
MTKTNTTEVLINNGVNTEALIGARGAFSETPEAAAFTFRSTCDWVDGTESINSINGYFGLGQEHERKQT